MSKKKSHRLDDARKAAVDAVNKSAKQLRKALEGNAKDLRKAVEGKVDEGRKQAQKVSLDATLSVVHLQKKGFDTAFKAISKVQSQAEKSVRDAVKKADWIPSEGKEVVDDWAKMLKEGREDFQKTVDKSFDLMTKFLHRQQKSEKSAKKSGGASSSASRKRVTAKKAAAKKPTKKKAAAKKPAKKKASKKKAAKSAS